MRTPKKLALATLMALGAFHASDIIAQTTPAAQPSICNRACWTARAPKSTPTQMGSLTRAIIHHTAGSSDYNVTTLEDGKAKVRGVQNVHMDANGWSDIGYHFLVDKNGNLFEGRAGSMTTLPRGAHDGNNTDSFGFTLLGYFHSPYNHDPNATMRGKIYDCIAWRMPSGWTPYGSGTYNGNTVGKLDGHRKVKATACPGDTMHPPYITENYNGGDARTGVANRRTPAPPASVIVDGATGSASWITATSATDKYGADYKYRSTESVSDAATFTGNLPSTKTYTVSAWWSQGANRSATAPYLIDHSGGTATVNVNQQANGGKWNSLGSYSFASGNRTVRVSCWTTTGFVVIADAVKFE